MIKIDLSEEIKNRRNGSHHISLKDKEILKEQIKILKRKDIFNKYRMSYTYRELEGYILLLIYKSFDFINQVEWCKYDLWEV